MTQTSWLGAATATLATKRITRLVVDDVILNDVRDLWFKKFPPETTKLGYLVSCPKCVSVWAGFTVAGLTSAARLHRTLRAAVAIGVSALAMSEATILATEFEQRVSSDDSLFN